MADQSALAAAWDLTGIDDATPEQRRQRGAWYTPRSVVEAIVALALPDDGADLTDAFVVDPACGAGAFLLGALDRLVELGLSPTDALGRVGGIDVDAGAVARADKAVAAWAGAQGVAALAPGVRLACADALAGWPQAWPNPTVIVGNPPFATPLKGSPLPTPATAWREAHRELLGPYADLATVHLAVAADRLSDGGRLSFVLPQSVVASRDTEGLRRSVAERASLVGVWASRERHFEASVHVWAPVLEFGRSSAKGESTWAEQVAAAIGIPDSGLGPVAGVDDTPPVCGVLGDIVEASAGFRDEYYGLVPAVSEAVGGPTAGQVRLITSGSIDPLHCRWGSSPIRFAKRSWDQPVVTVDRVEAKAAAWVERERAPKVLVATQAKIIEPVIDRVGDLLGVTPVVSLRASSDQLSAVAAVLLAPPVTAWAARRWFGTAMTPDSIKLAAAHVGRLPLPLDETAWQAAASVVDELAETRRLGPNSRDGLIRVAELMNVAYGLSGKAGAALLTWWSGRLPPTGRA